MISVYTVVWNEEFMLPHFLKHYEKVAKRIVVVDDHSSDKTPEIAKAHPKVTYVKKDTEGWNEQETSDIFSDLALQFGGWAVCVDADEFIQGLETLGRPKGQIFKTIGYMMVGETGRLEDCFKVRMKTFDKPVVFDGRVEVKFGDGRHTVNLPTTDSNLELWHYKYPSREYYLERNLAAYPRIMDKQMMDYRIKRGLDYYNRALADGGKS